MIWALAGCRGTDPAPATAPALGLDEACDEFVGEARVEEPAPGVFVAIGHDLANTIVLQGTDGLVVIDPGMSPERARRARAALADHVEGPVRAVVYTHSHLDHVGAAEVWVEEGTDVWATDAWVDGFFHQYGRLLPSEAARARRQFGADLPDDLLPCNAIGARPDLGAPVGVVMPTDTFTGSAPLSTAGLELLLLSTPGETDDHLTVYWPERGAVMPGDNWYAAFPNLYTIRGTTPRSVDAWIGSLDAVRRLEPTVLVPSHTAPLVGADVVSDALIAHRDAIQTVRDAVIRGSNQGLRRDALVESVALAPELAARPTLGERYGRVDWSARAVADATVGWFDGRAASLDRLPVTERARRTLEAMGGAAAVRERAADDEDPRWALELLVWLEDAGEGSLSPMFAQRYDELAARATNANERAYYAVAARERRAGTPEGLARPTLSEAFVDGLVVRNLFDALASRLRPAHAAGVHEAVRFEIGREVYVVTVRNRVAEVAEGAPLPGTPPVLATLRADASTWRRLALELDGAPRALAEGRLSVEGDALALWRFLGRFDRGLAPPPTTLP